MRSYVGPLRLQLVAVLMLAIASCTPVSRDAKPEAKPEPPPPTNVLPGEGGVSGGAATYEIPIEVPKDGDSFRPRLDVEYSSRSGLGLLGTGWTLAAGGSVHRCPFIPDGDGISREVRFAPDDRLCIDGTKMVLFKGDYGKNESVYIPEINASVEVQLHGDLNSPTSAFATFDSAGNIRLYGAQVIGDGVTAPLSWQLGASIQKDGATIEYKYTDFGHGEILLSRIVYGSKYDASSGQLIHGDKFVRITYASREPISTSFLSGSEIRASHLITRITTGTTDANGTESVFRDYVFSYGTALSTGRPLLESAQACHDVSALSECTAVTHFGWQDAPLAFASPEPIAATPPGAALAGEWRPGATRPVLATYVAGGDYNADGRRDLLVRSADGQGRVVVLQPGRSVVRQADLPRAFEIPPGLDVAHGLAIREVGSAEVVGGLDGHLAVLDWIGDGFAPPAATSIPYTNDAMLIDATGDGLNDVVTASRANGEYAVMLYRNEGSTDKELKLSAGEVVARFKDAPGLHLDARSSSGGARTVAVRDGDALAHFVRFSSENDGRQKVQTFAPADAGISAEAIAQGFVLADVNGDGYDDVVYGSKSGTWKIQLNTGVRFAEPVDTHAPDTRSAVGRAATLVFDVDTDGRSDIVYPARRVADFCVKRAGADALCSDAIAAADPRMDLGIYEYDAIDFPQDANGQFVARVSNDLHLVGQANRVQPADVFGDGYAYLMSPFDRGVANGAFKANDGSLADCPPTFGCGLRIAARAHIKRDDRSDAPLELLVRAEKTPGRETKWTYYPISNPVRHLYTVPPLGSPDRYIDSRHYYFTSSMFVAGEMAVHDAPTDDVVRFDYGAAQYSTAGRGFDGFKWIIVHDDIEKKKYGSWFLQDGPYRAMQQYAWTEAESDTENDYFHGSPGKHSLSFEKYELGCAGPKDDPATLRYGCKPEDSPAFRTFRKK